MEQPRIKRKLAVILAADFEGYTRLMHTDEEATLKTLRAHREIVDKEIVRYAGRVFNTAGDSIVAEFGSAVEAVRCSIAIQEELTRQNAFLPDVRKMNLRIGVNLGDVMVVGENLLGDGVNVAARLEGMADAGGICISSDVYNQVKHKLTVSFEDMGPQRLKNISEPVPVFRIVPGASVKRLEVGTSRLALRRWRTLAMAVALIAGFTVAFAVLWKNVFAPETTLHDMVSERPSIAVLHFKNLTGEKSHDYFSEGVSETIMTQLTEVPGIAVVSHTSSSSYGDEHVEPQEVGRRLGVRYVLEGGVQISGERTRITAKLIDASTGKHVWAESYDQKAEDIFTVQDDITLNIVKALGVELAPKEWAALTSRRDNAPNSMNPSGAQERTMTRRMRQDDAEKPPATGSSTRPRSQM